MDQRNTHGSLTETGTATEGDLINRAIEKKRHAIKCPCCEISGAMRRNGGATPAKRSWLCRACNRQVTGQGIVVLLEKQIGPLWRSQVTELHKRNGIPAGEVRKAQCKAREGQERETITISRRDWNSVMEKISQLNENYENIYAEHEKVCTALAQVSRRLERVENECAINGAALRKPTGPRTVRGQGALNETERNNTTPWNLPTGHEQRQMSTPISKTKHPSGRNNHSQQIEQSAENSAKTTPRGKKLNWAEITKLNRPETAKIIPTTLHTKIQKRRQLLIEDKYKQTQEPKPCALYFKNIRRGPLGAIRHALRECLPSWALLGLDFVGSSILELVTGQNLKHRVIATMRMMGIEEIKDFDVMTSAARSHKGGESRSDLKKRNLKSAAHRFERNANNSKNQWAARWYRKQLEEAQERLDLMKEAESTQDGPRGTEKGSGRDASAQTPGDEWTVVAERRRTRNRAGGNSEESDPMVISNERDPSAEKVQADGTRDTEVSIQKNQAGTAVDEEVHE